MTDLDPITKMNFACQYEEVTALADQSDLVDVTALRPDVPHEMLLTLAMMGNGTPQDLMDLIDGSGMGGYELDPEDPPTFYVARYYCRGLVRRGRDRYEMAEDFAVGIRLFSDYLNEIRPQEMLVFFAPKATWHPNINAPGICVGDLPCGTPLTSVLHQVFDVITYNNVTMVEHDALNHEACQWARGNPDHLQLDHRPLKWRASRAEASTTA